MPAMTERVHIYRDSLSSFYDFTDNEGGRPIDVDEATTDRWASVMAEFEAVQDEMEAAYAEAVKRDAAAEEVRKAEQAVADAQARLAQIRYEQEHPLEDPDSWVQPREQPPGAAPCTQGRRYVSEAKAWEGRVEVYDTVARRGGQMAFDIAPYVCTEGHWHLGRVTS